MSNNRDSDDRWVHLGPRELKAAKRLLNRYGIEDRHLGARTAVTIAAALDNASRVGFAMRLIGTDGRQYGYDLGEPKLAHELDKKGERTGKTINLIDLTPSPTPTPKPKLRRVK